MTVIEISFLFRILQAPALKGSIRKRPIEFFLIAPRVIVFASPPWRCC